MGLLDADHTEKINIEADWRNTSRFKLNLGKHRDIIVTLEI